MKALIWSRKCVAWLTEGGGYTPDMTRAALYTLEDAEAIAGGTTARGRLLRPNDMSLVARPLAELGPRITEDIQRCRDVIAEQQRRITALEALAGGTGA